jgi:galactosylceramidase
MKHAVPLILSLVSTLHAEPAAKTIRLDPASPGREFTGIGAVSAGASSRLLIDYPEPQRSEILDFLFKPKFGAGFQHLKVEIGGGENSTCGSEPSHAITRDELAAPKPRGYEFWLMAEARKRNPALFLDCLPWAFPAWIGEPFSQNSADYFAAFLETARTHHGLEIDWLAAAQNELGTDTGWLRNTLRPTLDARGFQHVKLQAPDDDSGFWEIFDELDKDPALDGLVQAVGYHYIDGRRPWDIDQKDKRHATEKAKQSGKPLWASEEWSQSGKEWGGTGALYLARLMNKLYIKSRITKYLMWCPIDSIYDQIIWADTGAMQADSPWSGHYAVWPAVWAVAHTTQFAEPGWIYMDDACGQLDPETWRGTHVALRHPQSGDWAAIVITGDARRIRLEIAGGLTAGPVAVWKSNAGSQFEKLPPLEPVNGAIELALEADAIYTFTNTTGQQKGSHGTPPPRTPFPFPYAEDFEHSAPGSTPRYFSDQKGTFEVAARPDGGGNCLAQIVPGQGILWMGHQLNKPHSLFGDTEWSDHAIEAEVYLTGGDAEIGGRYRDRGKLGYRLILAHDGTWKLNWQETTLAGGVAASFDPAAWHHLRLEFRGDQIRAHLGGALLAEVTDTSNPKGMAVLASSYHRNLFDKVRVTPLPGPGR